MNTKEIPVWLIVLITALVAGGAVYLLTGKDQSAPSLTVENSIAEATASSREYAVMGRELWSAFSCSSWASILEDEVEQGRLFMYGYSQGHEFLLGQLFAFAQDSALDEVFTTNGEYNSTDMQKIIAQNKFTDSNCELIGE